MNWHHSDLPFFPVKHVKAYPSLLFQVSCLWRSYCSSTQEPMPLMPLPQVLGVVKRKMKMKLRLTALTVNQRRPQKLRRLLKRIVAVSQVNVWS